MKTWVHVYELSAEWAMELGGDSAEAMSEALRRVKSGQAGESHTPTQQHLAVIPSIPLAAQRDAGAGTPDDALMLRELVEVRVDFASGGVGSIVCRTDRELVDAVMRCISEWPRETVTIRGACPRGAARDGERGETLHE